MADPIMHISGKAVVLLSGGLDSATALALVHQHCAATCLAVDYGQRNSEELICADRVAAFYKSPIVRAQVSIDGWDSPLTSDGELGL